MVKYIHQGFQFKNPCIIFLNYRKSIDIDLIDIYLELNSTNNFFKKLLKNTEVFFLTITYFSTVEICLYRHSSTHAKGNLA